MSSPYTDMDRPPLNETALQRALVRPGGLWTDVRYLANTGSTNADVATAARDGAAEGLLIVADEQSHGRGRLDREWQSPPRAGIAMSVLLRPGDAADAWPAVPTNRFGFLPLLAGVALVETVRRLGEVDAALKWPNDLLINERKCAGILAESVGDGAIAIGIGLNVTLRQSELPRADATSLQLSGSSCVDRDPLVRSLARDIESWYARWRDAGGDAATCGLLASYRFHCATIGANVSVSMPGGADIVGVATEVDDDGRLVVGDRAVAAGDVIHLRSN